MTALYSKGVCMDVVDFKGKNGLDVIKDNTEFLIALPWNNELGVFKIRMLNATQIRACGNFTTLSFEDDNLDDDKEQSLDDIIALKTMHETIAKNCMVSPTYKEAYDFIGNTELITSMRERCVKVREEIKLVTDMKEAEEYSKELDMMELFLEFLLPDDFLAGLTTVIIQRDNTDIRKITKEMLFDAAVLAERGHNDPADHIVGLFTDFQKEDLNKYAWIELARYREMETMEKSGSRVWFRGNGKKKRR